MEQSNEINERDPAQTGSTMPYPPIPAGPWEDGGDDEASESSSYSEEDYDGDNGDDDDDDDEDEDEEEDWSSDEDSFVTAEEYLEDEETVEVDLEELGKLQIFPIVFGSSVEFLVAADSDQESEDAEGPGRSEDGGS